MLASVGRGISQFTFRGVETDDDSIAEKLEAVVVPNGGYGWVIVGASFVVHALTAGNIYVFGVFFPTYVEEFGEPLGSVAWIGSIASGLMTGLGAYAGSWADQYGNGIIVSIGGALVSLGFLLASFSTEIWHLYLTQGFITGLGYGLAFIAGVSVVGQWFTTRRGLAVGIAVAGSGLGQFALSIMIGSLIEQYGWRTAIRYLSLVAFIGLQICGLLIKRTLPCVKPKNRESRLHLFTDRNFNLLYLGSFFASLGLFMPYTHLSTYAENYDISRSSAVLILSIIGVASAFGRVFLGIVSDWSGKVRMLQFSLTCGGISILCWMACTTFVTIMIFGIIFGIFAGGIISLIPTACAELFGIENLGAIVGVLYTSSAVGSLMSAPIAGFFYDAYGNYDIAISFAGSCLIFGGFFTFFVETPSTSTSKNDKLGLSSSETEEKKVSEISNLEIEMSNIENAENNNESEQDYNESEDYHRNEMSVTFSVDDPHSNV